MDNTGSAAFKQYLYLIESNTESGISANTGIPRSTLYDFKMGIRDLPDKWKPSLENFYHRQAYSDLKTLGMNADEASKYSKLSPNSVRPIKTRMTEIVDYLSDGLVTQYKKTMREGIDYVNEDYLRLEAQETIRDGLRNSQKTLVDWENY